MATDNELDFPGQTRVVINSTPSKFPSPGEYERTLCLNREVPTELQFKQFSFDEVRSLDFTAYEFLTSFQAIPGLEGIRFGRYIIALSFAESFGSVITLPRALEVLCDSFGISTLPVACKGDFAEDDDRIIDELAHGERRSPGASQTSYLTISRRAIEKYIGKQGLVEIDATEA